MPREIRAFSIASSPHEETLMVATRIRDTAFKRVLSAMPLGSVVKIEGPSGDLTLHNNVKRTAVFLAGGIGITPFRSIVCRAAKEKLPHRIFLFYSNRRPEDAPFLDELQALQEENPNYTLIATMTEMPKSHRLRARIATGKETSDTPSKTLFGTRDELATVHLPWNRRSR